LQNGIYRINEISDGAGRYLRFDYNDLEKTITATDNEGRTFEYKLNNDGQLQEVINEYGKGTRYTYYTSEDFTDDDPGNNVNDENLEKLSVNIGRLKNVEIQVEKEVNGTIVEEYQVILTNYYDQYERIYKQDDAYKKVKYWLFLDVNMDENAEPGTGSEVIGSVKRQFIDQNNVATTIEYSSFLKHPIKEEHPDGGIIEYEYEIKYNGAWTNITNIGMDEAIKIIGNKDTRYFVKDKYGYTTMREIDVNGNLVKETERYDASAVATVDAPYTEYSYDFNLVPDNLDQSKNNLIKVEEKKANNITDSKTEYVYDGVKLVMKKERIDLDDGNEVYAVTEYTYNPDHIIKGLVQTVTNPDGVITEFEYYTNGYLKVVKDQDGNETKYVYDGIGRVVEKTTQMGFKTIYQYKDEDENESRVKKIIVSDGKGRNSITLTEEDGYGNIIREVTPKQYEEGEEYETRYEYNLRNELVKKIEKLTTGDIYITRYEYDNAGNLQKEIKPNGDTYVTEYDKMNRIKKLTYKKDPNEDDGVVLEEYFYTMPERETGSNLKNNVIEKRVYYEDEQDKYITTKVIRDYKANTETIEEEGIEEPLVKEYSKNNKLMKEIRGDKIIWYAYDGLGRITAKRTSIEKKNGVIYYTRTKYEYTPAGNLKGEFIGLEKVPVDENPSTYIGKIYEYDNMGRLKEVFVQDAKYVYQGGQATPTVTVTKLSNYNYDDDGNLSEETIEVGNEVRITKYKNNHLGLPDVKYEFVWADEVYEIPDDETGAFAIVTEYEYDADGNTIKETTGAKKLNLGNDFEIIEEYGTEVIKKHQYDDYGRVIKTIEKGSIIPEGSSSSQPVVQDIITETEYDWEGRPVKVIDGRGNVTEYTYTYEDTGLVEKMVQTLNGESVVSVVYYDWAGRVIAEVSPDNYVAGADISQMNRTVYVYEENQLKEKRYMGDLTEFTSSSHPQKQTSNINMVIRKYEYDNYGNKIKEWDGVGYQDGYYIEYEYNLADMVTKVIDPEAAEIGRYTTRYEYDGLGRLTVETNLKGNTIANGHPKGIFYSKTAYDYDYLNNVTRKWVGRGTTDSFDPRQVGELIEENSYDILGNLISHIDGNGNTTKYKYNSLGELKEVKYPIDSTMEIDGTSAYRVNYEYDAARNLRRESDNYDKEILYEYDGTGRLQSKTSQKIDGTESITVGTRYDSNGNVRFEIDGRGNKTEYKYDELNKLIEKKQVVIKGSETIEHIESYTYDKNGNLMTTTNSVTRGGNTAVSTEENVYDEINRLIEKKDAYDVSIEKIIYDESNRQIYSFDALSQRTDYEYDKNGRLIKTIYPELSLEERRTESNTYDFAGNVMIKKDGENNKTTYVYDEFDRLDYVVDAIGQNTNYEYDLNGNMVKQEMFDVNGDLVLSTTYQYNASNLMTKKIDHNGSEDDSTTFEEYKYNAKGELRKKFGRNRYQILLFLGTEVTYEYDIHGRLMKEMATNPRYSRVEISYEYDANGNQIKMTDSTGETIRIYDELNRTISKNVGNISGEALYEYDIIVSDGNDYLTAEVSEDNKGNTVTKVYDKAGRLKYVVDDELVSGSSISNVDPTKLTEYSYYDNGARESISHPQFTEGSNTYRYKQFYTYYDDGLLRILLTRKMMITSSGETAVSQLERFDYRYDKAGNQIAKIEIVNGVLKGRTDFEYDGLNRLKKVIEPNGRETVYTFDAAGNRKTETITESGTTINKTYYYNDKNLLTKIEILGAETIEYDYDENGNQIKVSKVENGVTEVIAEYKYDSFNRLIEAITDTDTVTYAYNGEGRRIRKSTGQETINYLYEYDKVVLEVDGNGNQTARNLYGINLLMRDVDGESYYYVYNGHADVTALINADTGVVEATYYYDPFGNILESTGSVNNNITYAGYQYDEETGLYYLNARMYDPKIARFLQEDTYRGDPNDPLSLNLYSYCANNPITYYDPTGHIFEMLKGLFGGGQKNDSTTVNYYSTSRQGMPTDLWIRVQEQQKIREGRIIERKMMGDESAEKIRLGDPGLEHSGKMFLQDEVDIDRKALEVMREKEREYKLLYLQTGERAYADLLMEVYNDYYEIVDKQRKLGFQVEDFEFVRDDNYYKRLYEIYWREDNFVRWLFTEERAQLLFSESQSYLFAGIGLLGTVAVQNVHTKAMEGFPYSNVPEPEFKGFNISKEGTSKTLNSFDDVADYIKKNGKLPDNFITKDQAKALGWDPKKGNLADVAPGKSIGGDIFKNKGTPLPDAPGRVWYEADINYSGGFRGTDRIIYSNDGLIYKTSDHYKTFTQIK
jgi:RHS repeat-associated protein